jgi:5-(carboxyamino)imidazole ribonucleotide synthase
MFFNKKIGILGGGQLGQMLFQSAISFGFYPSIFGGNSSSSCRFIKDFTTGTLYDDDAIVKFGQDLDILTIEVEHISTDALKILEKKGVEIFPKPAILELISDKSKQNQFYKKHNFPIAKFWTDVESKDIPYPAIAKTCKGGYDGKGVASVHSKQDAIDKLGSDFFIEEKINIKLEFSILIARSKKGEIKNYPLVDMEFDSNCHILKYSSSPSKLQENHSQQAIKIATSLIEKLDYVGLMSVEFFLTTNNEILINEVAPRVHNSGHHTQDACNVSQFEQHWRAILDLPLGDTELKKAVVGLNLLGKESSTGGELVGLDLCLQNPDMALHLYSKNTATQNRKMGHINSMANTVEEARDALDKISDKLFFGDKK